MANTDFGVLGDTRINKELDFKNINSKKDYEQAVKKLLDSWSTGADKRAQNLKPFINDIYEESDAKNIVESKAAEAAAEEENESLRRQAERFERTRERISRTRDERKTAKDTRPINVKSLSTWKRKPGKLDLKGIDTRKSARSRKGLTTRTFKKRALVTKKYSQRRR